MLFGSSQKIVEFQLVRSTAQRAWLVSFLLLLGIQVLLQISISKGGSAMTQGRRKLLVALDGSQASLDTVSYLAHMLARTDTAFVLLSIVPHAPENIWDFQEVPEEGLLDVWCDRRKKALEGYMEDARRILLQGGFGTRDVVVEIRRRQEGIARDIMREAWRGYDGLVIGRVGMNPIARLVLGSMASKLVDSLAHMPVWLVSRCILNRKILLAIDASEGARRCVTYAARMLAGTDTEITLFHILRGHDVASTWPVGTRPSEADVERWMEIARQELRKTEQAMSEVIGRATEELVGAGIDRDRITFKTVHEMATRGGVIAAQALFGEYSTIIIGRRGLSKVPEFNMGRVCNKVIQLSNELAVWVVD